MFSAWKSRYIQRKREKDILAGFGKKMKSLKLTRAFNSWTALIARRDFLRRFILKMLGRWKNSLLYGGFGAWRIRCSSIAASEAAEHMTRARANTNDKMMMLQNALKQIQDLEAKVSKLEWEESLKQKFGDEMKELESRRSQQAMSAAEKNGETVEKPPIRSNLL